MHKRRFTTFRPFYRTLLMALLVTASMLPKSARSLALQENKPVYLDIEFMVDQTEGMSSGDATHKPLDQDNHRNEAVRYAVNWLGEFRARQAEQGDPPNISVGVWGYGGIGATQCVVALQALTANTVDQWIASQQDTVSSTKATAPQSACDKSGHPLSAIRNNKTVLQGDNRARLHGVDYKGAFSKIADELKQYRATASDAHRQYVVVITGSQPELTSSRTQGANPLIDVKEQMTSLHDSFANGSISANNIYVLALAAGRSGFRDSPYGFPELTSPWIDDVGVPKDNVSGIDDVYQLSVKLHNIIQQQIIKSIRPALQTANDKMLPTQTIPAYQKRLTITLVKQTAKARLQVKVNGQVLSDSSSGIKVDGADTVVETWRITNPPPGTWELSAVQGTAVEFFADAAPLSFTAKVATNAINQYAPFTLVFYSLDTSTDANPKKLTELSQSYDANVTLHVKAVVTVPSGKQDTFDLLSDKDSGVYQANYAPVEAGLYQTVISASTSDEKGVTYSSSSDPTLKSGLTVSANPINFDVQFKQPLSDRNTDAPVVAQTQTLEGVLQAVDTHKSTVNLLELIARSNPPMLLLTDNNTLCSSLSADKALDKADFAFDDNSKSWRVAYVPKKGVLQSTYKVCLKLKLTVEQGSTPGNPAFKLIDIVSDARPTVTIKPVSDLAIMFVTPRDTTTQWDETIETAPLPQPNPLDVQVAIYRQPPSAEKIADSNGELMQGLLVDLRDSAHDLKGLTLNVISVDNPTLVRTYLLIATLRPGYWEAQIPTLAAGHYILQISTQNGVLGSSYDEFPLIAPDTVPTYKRLLTVVVPPIRYAKGLGLAAVLVILGVGTLQFTRPRVRPLRGHFSVWREQAATGKSEKADGWMLDLTRRNRNHVVCKLIDLPLFNPSLSYLEFKRGKTKDSLRVKIGIRGQEVRADEVISRDEQILLHDDALGWTYYLRMDADQPLTPKNQDTA